MAIRPDGLKLLTSSRKRTGRRCLRLHWLTYDLGWRSTDESEALTFGSLGHEALEVWWVEHIDDQALRDEHWRRIWARRGHAVEGDARAEWAPDPLGCALDAIDDAKADPYMKARVRAAIRGYDRRWADETARYRIIGVEWQFVAPLINPATGATSRTWALAGKLDVVVEDRETGIVQPIEHKFTAKDISTGGRYWKRLRMDGQLSTYIRGCRAEGYDGVDRATYDVIRRSTERPAKATPVEDRKFTKPSKAEPIPRLYKGQRETDETPAEFEERMYQTYVDRLAESFTRETVTRTDAELRAAGADDWALGQVLHAVARGGDAAAVRNVDACDGEDGSCDFLDVCYYGLGQLDDSSRFRRAESVHEELDELHEPPMAATGNTTIDQEGTDAI